MPDTTPASRAGLIASLLSPIQKVIQAILPNDVEEQLKAAPTRNAIVLAADYALVRQFPLARLVPPEARRQLIRKQLDIIIDEILLNDALPRESAGAGFESFILTVDAAATAPAETAEKAIRSVFGAEWGIAPLSLDDRSFEARRKHSP